MRCSLAIALAAILAIPATARADAFDNYTNSILAKVPRSKLAEPIKKLTRELMVSNSQALPGATATFIVVKTNDNRLSKLLVRPAAHKLADGSTTPIIYIERLVTFREGEERQVQASAHDLRLFDGFHFSLDIGQVVPAKLGGDLRCVVAGDDAWLEPVGKAEIFVVTKNFPEANPKKGAKLVVGDKFDPSYFNGKYKLYDDGRRSGTLHLKVLANGDVDGHYFSDKDGSKYDVAGNIGNPKHLIEFTVTFPRAVQNFRGMLFTGDGRAITGTSRLQERETGFYAVRIDD